MRPDIHIYALVDPRKGLVFYIGATRNLKSRLNCHISHAKRDELHAGIGYVRNLLIRDIVSSGSKPVVRILETVKFKDAKKREGYYYELYAKSYSLLQERHHAYCPRS